MLSSDRSEPGAEAPRHRTGRSRAASGAEGASRAHDEAAPQEPELGASEPWDTHSAEALMRLYESEDGSLSRPSSGDRAVRSEHLRTGFFADAVAGTPAPGDRTWLEAHLSQLVERLQAAVERSSVEPSLAALNGRLEEVEQRFAAALGRVAQRADVEALRSIETNVLELAGQLELARDRLDRIGTIDDQVRALARKLDEAGEHRAGALERLLRDSIVEWREGERRTAGALHSLEEAVSRLCDTVDALEASKPAPEITVPPLAGAGAVRLGDPFALHTAGGGRAAAPDYYRAMLDAADYAPTASLDEPLMALQRRLAGTLGGHSEGDDAVQWSGGLAGTDPARATEAKLSPGALRIKALRAKQHRSSRAGPYGPSFGAPDEAGAPATAAFRRASLSVLLMAGAAVLAGSTYFLYQAVVPTPPGATPVMIQPGAHPSDINPDLKSDWTDPSGRHVEGRDAG